MNLLSIVILNWNGKSFLEQFLGTLIENSAQDNVEIVVADNASTDGSVYFLQQEYPEIKLICFDENHGFAGGYNKALERLESKYFLLLNSDIEVTKDWLLPMIEFMESNPEAAACGPKIMDYNQRTYFEYAGAAGGYIDRFGYTFCRGRIFDFLEEDKGQYDQTVEIFWASGACFMIRSDVFQSMSGFDDQFFAHMEEVDLCWRMKKKGHSIWFIPGSRVYHVGGGTLPQGNPYKTYLNFRNNLIMLYKNLSRERYRLTIFIRLLLDGLSAFRFLFRGSFKDFRAIRLAHFDFFFKIKSYRKFRRENNSINKNVSKNEIYRGSIVIDYFLSGINTFDRLKYGFSRKIRRLET